MNPSMRIHILCITLLFSCTTKSQQLKPERIVEHIEQLSKDEMAGRGTGSAGERMAADYIGKQFRDLKLVPRGDNNDFFQVFPFSKGIHGTGEQGKTRNIIGFLDNRAKTTVVIGAHYDHLGDDGQGTSLDPNPKNKIHNGADDNASGVAGVIELARYFANNGINENNNFVFVCFSGEELGLLGSKYFTEHPPFDLTTADFMINMDMIGRLDPKTKNLLINGTGTSPVWEPLLKKIDTGDLKITTDSSGTGPSDHTSFYLKNVPVLHFFTGSHSDYHKPSDDVEKINAQGEAEVLKIIIRVIESLDSEPKLTFLRTKTKMQMSQSSFKVTMGIMPSYAGGVEGLKVDGVSDGKPAAAAGILTGDVIIRIGEYPVKDIYGYMEALGKFEKGQTVPVTIRRDKELKEVNVTF
jgi:hypothetical protein